MFNFILTKEQRDNYLSNWKLQVNAKTHLSAADNLEFHIFHSAIESIEGKIFRSFTADKIHGHYELYRAINSLLYYYKTSKRTVNGIEILTPEQQKQIYELLWEINKKVKR